MEFNGAVVAGSERSVTDEEKSPKCRKELTALNLSVKKGTDGIICWMTQTF